jgi:hypothetical protein
MTTDFRPVPTVPVSGAGDRPADVASAYRKEAPGFVWTVLALYVAFVSTVSALHEAWKDETQAWRLAVDSHGLRQLARNARYEGHPLLFHLIVQGLGHLSHSWWALATLHTIIASLAAWIVLRYAPFTRLQKVLLVFGYWMAYEYAVVVRPYGLGMMLAFAACVAWSARPRRIGWAAFFLVLLANTTAMGTLLAMTLALAFGADWAWPDGERPRPSRRSFMIGAGIAAAATAFVLFIAAAQIKPPADAGYQGETRAPETLSTWDIGAMPTVELRALVPVVRYEDGVVQWNRWLLKPESRAVLGALLLASMAALAIGAIIASRRRTALILFVVGTTGFLLFFGLLFPGTAHHHGYLFLVWALSAWLAWSDVPTAWRGSLQRLSDFLETKRRRLFTLSLVLPIAATIELAVADLFTPFADARHVADIIQAEGLQNATIIAIVRSHAQAVGAFLDRAVLYPREGIERRFVVWGAESPYRETVRAADSALTARLTRECRVVLIASPSKDVPTSVASRARLIYTTPRRPMSGDRYRVWVATAPDSVRCPPSRRP